MIKKKLLLLLQITGLCAVVITGCNNKIDEQPKTVIVDEQAVEENIVEEDKEEILETSETVATEEETVATELNVVETEEIESGKAENKTEEIESEQEELLEDPKVEEKDTEKIREDVQPQTIITEVEKYKIYAKCGLNLRVGPGTNYKRLSSIGTAGEMTVIAKADNGWLKVIYRDKEYFCSEKYTSTEKPVVQQAPSNSTTSAKAATNGVPGAAALPAELLNSPYHNVFKPEGDATNSVCVQANNYWNYTVPDALKVKLVNNGWHFAISGQRLADRYGYSMSIAGITDYGSKTILLDNRSKVVKRATLHEIGHAVDQIHGWPSLSGEFAQIFEAEKYSFVDCTAVGDGHETSNIQEYFASVFQNAIINAGNTSKNAPQSYNFVMKYMN